MSLYVLEHAQQARSALSTEYLSVRNGCAHMSGRRKGVLSRCAGEPLLANPLLSETSRSIFVIVSAFLDRPKVAKNQSKVVWVDVS